MKTQMLLFLNMLRRLYYHPGTSDHDVEGDDGEDGRRRCCEVSAWSSTILPVRSCRDRHRQELYQPHNPSKLPQRPQSSVAEDDVRPLFSTHVVSRRKQYFVVVCYICLAISTAGINQSTGLTCVLSSTFNFFHKEEQTRISDLLVAVVASVLLLHLVCFRPFRRSRCSLFVRSLFFRFCCYCHVSLTVIYYWSLWTDGSVTNFWFEGSFGFE